MMYVACQFSDRVFATADDPRHESMEAIFEDMKPGNAFRELCHFFEPDRGGRSPLR
ncbi:MAG: hypothetical protein LBD60_02105 [Puniceicoccales bacterium]|jgi:UDP-N-acetylmuramyl tripeptide synthase|nr:hypothetical protein [Puniceicoccales bacterium]